MPRRIRVIAKRHPEVPIDQLAKVLIAQARAERQRRQAHRRRAPEDGS